MNIVTFWSSKTPKEKTYLFVGAVVMVFGIIYHLAFSPLNEKLMLLEQSNSKNKELLAWMQEHKTEVLNKKNSVTLVKDEPMFQLAQKSFKNLLVDGKAPKISKLDENRVSVVFEKVAFDLFVKKLELLVENHQLSVELLSAKKLDEAGYVTLSCTLTR